MKRSRVIIVVGGQYGSEGKGKVVNDLVQLFPNSVCVRCGGPNSGHTTMIDGKPVILRALPSGVSDPNAVLCIPAGAVIDIGILRREINECGVTKDRVLIDPRAVLIGDTNVNEEAVIKETIGSTGSGNGAALLDRMRRDPSMCVLVDHARIDISRFATITNVSDYIYAVKEDRNVIVEGNQGFGLSLLHGTAWPFCTSRDVTVAGFCSEVGIAPRDVTDVICVIRTWPIRVGGNSGPMTNETDWETVAANCHGPVEKEYTSVTKKLRRVGWFDSLLVQRACRVNGATALAVMGLDRYDYRIRGNTHMLETRDVLRRWHSVVGSLSKELTPIYWAGTGPTTLVRNFEGDF